MMPCRLGRGFGGLGGGVRLGGGRPLGGLCGLRETGRFLRPPRAARPTITPITTKMKMAR
jgi:hypothetical protein